MFFRITFFCFVGFYRLYKHILSYKKTEDSAFFRRMILVITYFSYILSEQFIVKRKENLSFAFFLVDPNAIVYCIVIAFFYFFMFFLSICLFIRFSFYIAPFTIKNEFFFYVTMFVMLFYMYRWSFIFVDADLSISFKFTPIQTDTRKDAFHYWDFSVYFFNYFGLFFDTFFSFSAYYFLMTRILFITVSDLYTTIFNWMARINLYILTLYFFSGEGAFFYATIFFLAFIFRELLCFIRSFFDVRNRYTPAI